MNCNYFIQTLVEGMRVQCTRDTHEDWYIICDQLDISNIIRNKIGVLVEATSPPSVIQRKSQVIKSHTKAHYFCLCSGVVVFYLSVAAGYDIQYPPPSRSM